MPFSVFSTLNIWQTVLSKALCIHCTQGIHFYWFIHSRGIKPTTLALLVPCSTVWATGILNIMKENENWTCRLCHKCHKKCHKCGPYESILLLYMQYIHYISYMTTMCGEQTKIDPGLHWLSFWLLTITARPLNRCEDHSVWFVNKLFSPVLIHQNWFIEMIRLKITVLVRSSHKTIVSYYVESLTSLEQFEDE